MRRILLGDRGLLLYSGFIAASGLALMLSMPWATTLNDLMNYPWRPLPTPFFLTYGFLSACLALDRAAEAVPVLRPRLATLAIAGLRVALAQVVVLPLVALSRVLFPDTWAPIPLGAAYIAVVSLALSGAAVVLEILAVRRGKHPAVLRYAGLVAYLALPAVFLGLGGPLRVLSQLSPAVALLSIVTGTSGLTDAIVAFSVPALAWVGFCAWVFVLTRGNRE